MKTVIIIENQEKCNPLVKQWLNVQNDDGDNENLMQFFNKNDEFRFIVFQEQSPQNTINTIKNYYTFKNKSTFEEVYLIVHIHENYLKEEPYKNYDSVDQAKTQIKGLYKESLPKAKIETESHTKDSFYSTIMPKLIDENQSVDFSEIEAFFFDDDLEEKLAKPLEDYYENCLFNFNKLTRTVNSLSRQKLILPTKEIINQYADPNNNKKADNNNYAVFLEAKYSKGAYHQNLEGFELIYKFRKDIKFKGGIHVFSFISEKDIESFNYPTEKKYPSRILKTQGIFYYNLNIEEVIVKDQLKNQLNYFSNNNYLLSDYDLKDILEYSQNYMYLLSEYIHDYFLQLNTESVFLKKVLKITEHNTKKEKEIIEIIQNAYKVTENKEALKNKLTPYLINSKKKSDQITTKNKWSILIIDDDEEVCESFKEKLKNLIPGINIIKISKYDEYFNFKNDDVRWIICDLKLSYSNQKRWPHQGWTILEKFYSIDPRRALSAITQSSTMLKKSLSTHFNQYNISVHDKTFLLNDDTYFKAFVLKNIDKIEASFEQKQYPDSWEELIKLKFNDFEKNLKELYNTAKTKLIEIRGESWETIYEDIKGKVKKPDSINNLNRSTRNYNNGNITGYLEELLERRIRVIIFFLEHKDRLVKDKSERDKNNISIYKHKTTVAHFYNSCGIKPGVFFKKKENNDEQTYTLLNKNELLPEEMEFIEICLTTNRKAKLQDYVCEVT